MFSSQGILFLQETYAQRFQVTKVVYFENSLIGQHVTNAATAALL